ncbi:MAG: choice-of-anchor A family protein [Clostridia bacterium]|nr:choice-of-anchor A family protein [Clostridia bacterium]
MKNRELKYLFSVKGIILTVIAAIAAVTAVLFCLRVEKTYGAAQDYGNPVVLRSRDHESDESASPIMSYKEMSYTYKELSATCTEWTDDELPEGSERGLYFISRDNLQYCIYDTDASALCGGKHTLTDFNYMWLNSEDDGFYVLINLAGKNIDLSGYYVLARDRGYVYASRVIINCYEAETVDLGGAILTGTLLAPYASVRLDAETYIFGQVLSDSLAGEAKTYREIKFTGYYDLLNSQDSVSFANDAVRAEAVRYLITHNEEGLYSGYNADSRLKKSDLGAVKELDLSGHILKTGFEKDLAMLTGLEVLKLNDTNITQLTLTGFEYLRELEVNNTPLTGIDLSGAPALMRLSLEHTALTSLDLSGNTQLRILCLAGSRIGQFPDVPEPFMEYIDVTDTGLTNNMLTGTNFPVLKTLLIADNPDFSGLVLSSFTALETLDCSNTAVSVLALPLMPQLKYIRVSGTRIESLDLTPIKHLYVCEAYCDSLKELKVNRYADALYTNIVPTVVN